MITLLVSLIPLFLSLCRLPVFPRMDSDDGQVFEHVILIRYLSFLFFAWLAPLRFGSLSLPSRESSLILSVSIRVPHYVFLEKFEFTSISIVAYCNYVFLLNILSFFPTMSSIRKDSVLLIMYIQGLIQYLKHTGAQ